MARGCGNEAWAGPFRKGFWKHAADLRRKFTDSTQPLVVFLAGMLQHGMHSLGRACRGLHAGSCPLQRA